MKHGLLPFFLLAASLFVGSSAAAQGLPYDRCGTIIQGVTCPLLFNDSDGRVLLLDDYGGFQVGDSAQVIGTFDPSCVTICQQGNGCVAVTFIGTCGGSNAVAYCDCASGAPCANVDAQGGCANSTGAGARLAATGTSSVTSDDLVLTTTLTTPNQFGIVYMGPGQLSTIFGDGLRCVGAAGVGVFRFPPVNGGAQGTLVHGPVVGHSQAVFPAQGQITAGSTWNFQAWYRDPSGPCGGGFNLSNGLSVTFTP